MNFAADLHLHSKYSRAVSPNMTIPVMAETAYQKGLNILASADWTHPLWFREIKDYLIDAEEGLFKLKNTTDKTQDIRFLLSVEISCIYTQGGKGRRIHNLVWCPSIETAEKITKELLKRGCNLSYDGRPIIGLSSKNLLQVILEIDAQCVLIPCHIWTPWFGLYGMRSGFISIEECFEDLSEYVYGIETGISSDPEMNWQIPELNTRSILSFSDAHSSAKMGREATMFSLKSLSYSSIREAIMHPFLRSKGRETQNKIAYTIEFYPEEGKYHYSGHRKCKVTISPDEQRKQNGICPVCKKTVTDGVMRRVQELANEDPRAEGELDELQVNWLHDPKKKHPPFVKLVPLLEIIAEACGKRVESLTVRALFKKLTGEIGSELDILLKIPIGEIAKVGGEKIAEGIQKVRQGSIKIIPGYDGEYGIVKIWHEPKNIAIDFD